MSTCLFLKLFINGESCQITQNTVTTEPSPKDMRGEGGGIYLIYSEAEIESGTINKNTAIAAAPDENGNIQGGLGGAISAKYSRVTIKGDTKKSVITVRVTVEVRYTQRERTMILVCLI